MNASDLRLTDLLETPDEGGIIRFNGERAVILDTVALGLLRHELIDALGLAGARAILTRFGWIHGWRTAETMKSTVDCQRTSVMVRRPFFAASPPVTMACSRILRTP